MSDSSEQVPSDAPTTYEQPVAPLGLRIVAFLFILLGVLSATEMVLSLVKGRFEFNLGILGIFIGRELLRRSEGWRSCGVLLLGLLLFFLVLGLIIYGIVSISFPWSNGTGDVSLSMSLGATIAAIVVVFWCFHVLRSKSSKAWCAEPYTPDPTRGRYQFTIRSMLLAMVVCSFVFARISTDDNLFYRNLDGSDGKSSSTQDRCFDVEYFSSPRRYSNKPDRLDCVIFFSWLKSQGNSSGGGCSPGHRTRTIDGVTVEMPNPFQLHEIVDGKHHTSNRRVTMEEFEAYLASSPKLYTLQGLLDFVDARRQNNK